MIRYIGLALIALPIIEIALFIKVGQTIGLWPTLALVIGAALLGSVLLRQQGLAVFRRLRDNVQTGRLPGRSMADAMMIGMAAILLVLPGFLTDIAALAILVPPIRSWLYAALARNVTIVETTTASRRSTIELDHDDYRPR